MSSAPNRPFPASAPRPLADGLDHPEGVVWSPRRGVVYAGGEGGQVYELTLAGEVRQIADTGGFVLGLALDAAGRIYACDAGRGEVVRVDPHDGAVETWSKGAPDAPFRTPNWPAFDAAGALYVTDSGSWRADDGLIQRIDPDGTTTVWSRAAPRFPNGCCLDADGTALLVVESTGPTVARIPIGPDGAAGAPEVVAELPGTVPDGVLQTAAGELVVTCYRPDVVLLVGADGPVALFEDPDGDVLNQPTNAAFAGPQLDRLVIANLGGWHVAVAETSLPALPLAYPELP